jgi:hypothetical protein
MLAGVFYDDIQWSSTGLTSAPPNQSMMINSVSFRGTPNGNNGSVDYGSAILKAIGPVTIHALGSSATNTGETPEITLGLNSIQLPGIYAPSYSTGIVPLVSYQDEAASILLTGTYGGASLYSKQILGNQTTPDNLGPNPGQPFLEQGLQFANSYMWWDIGNILATPTATGASGQNVLTVSSVSNISVGNGVYSPQVPSNTTVTAINSGSLTVTLSNNVSYPGLSGQAVKFGNAHSQNRCGMTGGPEFATGTFLCQLWSGTAWGTTWSVTPSLATFNESITTTGTIAAPGIGLGSMQNIIPNSANFSASTWTFPFGSQTATFGQMDPYGTLTATSWTLPASTYFQLTDTTTFPIVTGTSYTVCFYAMSSISGTVFNLNVANGGSLTGIAVPTSYPTTPTCILAGQAGTLTTQGINLGMQNMAGAATITIAAIWVVPPGVGNTYHPTAGVPDMNPTPAVVVGAYPTAFVFSGSGTLGGTSIPANSCSSLGTITVPGAAAGMAVSLAPASSIGSAFALGVPIITSNIVSPYLCNVTAAAATPTTVVWQARVSP